MPIRSPHGRAAAYRALWQWPLRSVTRLVITVLAVLVLVGLVSWSITSLGLGGSRSGGTSDVAVRPTDAAPATPSATALPPVPELEPATLPLSKAPPAALDVARRWSRAWIRPVAGISNEQWLAGLRSTTTDEYLGVLAAVDPTNIPAAKVIGNPKAVRVSPHSVQVQVQTDGPTLLVLVVDTGSGWRVAGYDRT